MRRLLRQYRLASALLAAAGSACLAVAPLRAQDPAPARIDEIFAPWNRPGSPGCALGVLRDGRFVYQRGYGEANLDYGIANGPGIVYYVGSVSKQFTAAAVALLAQEGRIGLDDDVRRWFPELPDYGRPITIRQLIHHTSGLRDIYTLMELAGLRLEDVFPDSEAMALIARQREPNFPPGTDYLYSNSGYFLLGQLVRRVTGQSLREYAAARIFQPLGMSSTHFHDQPWTVVRDRAVSYQPDGSGFRISYLANFDKAGAGGLYTTLADLAKWDANFYRPEVGGEALLKTLLTRGVLANGVMLDYAFGLTLGRLLGRPIVRHGGAMMGFRADLLRFPAERTTIMTLCNLGTIDPGALADRVAALYLRDLDLHPVAAGDAPPAPAGTAGPGVPEAPARAGAGEAKQEFAGRYRSDELAAVWDVAWRSDTLWLTRRLYGTRPLRALGPDRFAAGSGHELQFGRDSAGRVTSFTLQAGRVRNIRFERDPPVPAPH